MVLDQFYDRIQVVKLRRRGPATGVGRRTAEAAAGRAAGRRPVTN
jgi:hypothetical protein